MPYKMSRKQLNKKIIQLEKKREQYKENLNYWLRAKEKIEQNLRNRIITIQQQIIDLKLTI